MIPLLRAAHLLPTVAVTTVTTALAVSAGRGPESVWVGLAVLAGQLSVGWSNDYLDRERDRATGRLDKPIVAGAVAASTVRAAACLALVACVPLSFLSGWRAALVHLGAVGFAWSYNAALKQGPWSVVPYTVSFGALPAFVTLGLPGHPWPPAWAVAASALLGSGAHLVNALPDLDADRSVGIRGLPHRLGHVRSLLVAALLMGTAVAIAALAPPGDIDGVGVVLLVGACAAVGGVIVAGFTHRERTAWWCTLAVAASGVGLLVERGHALV
ncbi:MAG: UbiA family prenyltransferase [Acidimicrobiia bacterium]